MTKDFHKRFNIEVELVEVRKRFVNRLQTRAFYQFLHAYNPGEYNLRAEIAAAVGDHFDPHLPPLDYVGNDLQRTLLATETLHKLIDPLNYGNRLRELERLIEKTLADCELDIGVRWEKGKFYPSGAQILDEQLVNEPLRWLRESGHQTVVAPFGKALEHLLRSQKNPQFLADVITDMYEALEAMAKIVTESKKDLSANQEPFIKKVKASDGYKKILKEYVSYGCDFRHALEAGEKRPQISHKEAESFIYLTGLFIRLAMP